MEHCPDIRLALRQIGQEMEDGAIMPHIEGVRREGHLRDVAQHPVDMFGRAPQPLLRRFDGRLGNIEDGEVLVSSADLIV